MKEGKVYYLKSEERMVSMRKICKSIISSFLSLVLLASPFTVFAVSENASDIYSPYLKNLGFSQTEFENGAAILLNIIHDSASEFEISEEALLNGDIGQPINAYEYVDGELSQLAFVQYPFIYNDEVVFFLIYDGENVNLSRIFSDEVTDAMNKDQRIAFVYDIDSCYLVYEDMKNNSAGAAAYSTDSSSVDAECIYRSDEQITYRGRFANEGVVAATTAQAGTEFADITPNDSEVQFESTASVYAVSPSVQTSVSTILQPTGSSICWAASVVCIGTKLTSKSMTAIQVAKSVYGDDYDHGASTSVAMNALYNNYGVRYPYVQNAAPSDSIISSNLSAGKPVYSFWRGSAQNHAAVIWGIYAPSNPNSVLFVMDPANGKITVSKNSSGQYVNVSPSTGSWTLIAFASYSIS